MTDPQQYATDYAARGWPIVRCYAPAAAGGGCTCGPGCSSPGKHPIGGPLATVDPADVQRGDNIGIACGPAPGGGVLVIDCDVKPGGVDGVANLFNSIPPGEDIPPTPTVITGSGGAHLYFRHPGSADADRVPNSVGRIAPGVDVRSAGGFVVAPPSIHMSGEAYQWAPCQAPWDVDLADAPAWLVALARTTPAPATVTPTADDAAELVARISIEGRTNRATRYLAALPPAVEGSGGDAQTFAAAGVGWSFGLPADAFRPLLLEYNTRCKPPWDPADLDGKLANAYRYTDTGAYPYGWRLGDPNTPDVTPDDDPPAPPLDSGRHMDLATGWLDDRGAADGLIKSVGDRFFVYGAHAPGVWGELSLAAARSSVQQLHGALVYQDDGTSSHINMTPNKRNAIVDLALHDARVMAEGFLVDPPLGFAAGNCFVTVRNGRVVVDPHDPKHRAVSLFPWAVDADADRGPWLAWLGELFRDDPDAADKCNALQEFTGACLLGIAPQYARCLILTGEGQNGKSTFMEVLESLFPPDARGSSSPQDWAGHYSQYNIARLQSIRLNLVSEIPERQLMASDKFKQVITGERLAAREPGGCVFYLTPRAGHLFSANDLPATSDNSRGFWRRFLVLEFNRNFGAAGVEQKTKGQVLDSLRGAEPAIVSWALEGAERLIQAGGYTMPASHFDAIDAWRISTDSVADFVRDCCAINSDYNDERCAYLADLHGAFKLWAESGGRGRMANKTLAKRLLQVAGVERSPRGRRGVRFSIILKPSDEWLDYSGPRLALGRSDHAHTTLEGD